MDRCDEIMWDMIQHIIQPTFLYKCCMIKMNVKRIVCSTFRFHPFVMYSDLNGVCGDILTLIIILEFYRGKEFRPVEVYCEQGLQHKKEGIKKQTKTLKIGLHTAYVVSSKHLHCGASCRICMCRLFYLLLKATHI